MSRIRAIRSGIVSAVIIGVVVVPVGAYAHCDSTQGPIIPEARVALESGDITPVLKWVSPDNETELKTAFAKAIAVRGKDRDARDIADQYFIETFVRLHRAGEGAPFTGIKDEPVEPIVAMADRALAEGSVDDVINAISSHMAEAIRDRFAAVIAATRDKDDTVAAGREFVEAYVTYVHYVEGIHTAITAATAHHAEPIEGAVGHDANKR